MKPWDFDPLNYAATDELLPEDEGPGDEYERINRAILLRRALISAT